MSNVKIDAMHIYSSSAGKQMWKYSFKLKSHLCGCSYSHLSLFKLLSLLMLTMWLVWLFLKKWAFLKAFINWAEVDSVLSDLKWAYCGAFQKSNESNKVGVRRTSPTLESSQWDYFLHKLIQSRSARIKIAGDRQVCPLRKPQSQYAADIHVLYIVHLSFWTLCVTIFPKVEYFPPVVVVLQCSWAPKYYL